MSGDEVIHTEELPWVEEGAGELFAHRRRHLSRAAGGRSIGCSMYELEPGKTAFPFHYHLGNEEAVFVLEGEATLRLSNEHVRVREGDYVAFPPGEEHAHQLTNTGDRVFRYLVLSTMSHPEVIVYPDSDKVGVMAGAAPGGPKAQRVLTAFFPRRSAVGYYAGETGEAGAPEVAAAKREAHLEQQVDDEFEQLKRKLGLDDT